MGQKTAHVIILAGQSNAVGVGHTEYLPRHFSPERIESWKKGFKNVSINYFSHDKKSGGFVRTLTGCTEIRKKTIGPEAGLGEALSARYPDREIFIVKCAFGATSLHTDWISPSGGADYDPGAYADQKENIIDNYGIGAPIRPGWCYNELVRLCSESLDDLRTKGCTPEIDAFCWMQGEGDADTREHVSEYIRRFDALLSDFRRRFREEISGNCIFADAGISDIWMLYKELNAAKKEYAEAHGDLRYIDTIGEGLTTANEPEPEPDIYHYDSDSVIKLGRLFSSVITL